MTTLPNEPASSSQLACDASWLADVQAALRGKLDAPVDTSKRRRPQARGTGIGFRPQVALPPPAIAYRYRREQRAQLRQQRKTRDGAWLPMWAFDLAHDCRRNIGLELARLPPEVAQRLRNAAALYPGSEHARVAVMTLGVIQYWLALGHPKRRRRTVTLAGIATRLWARLTRNASGTPYSKSAVGHKWHGRGDTDEGLGDAGQIGFLPALAKSGFSRYWRPPATECAPWMVGPSGWSFSCIYVVPATEPCAAAPPPS